MAINKINLHYHCVLMRYICTLGLIIICFNAYASAGTYYLSTSHAARVTADSDTIVRKQSLSAGVSYGSDASFFGRTGPVRYPFFNTDVIYNAKSGVFIYGSAYKVLGSIPAIDEVDVGAGYYYRLSSRFTGNASYTRFIFDRNALIIKSASSNDINLNNSYDWKIVKTGLILDYLFGESDDFFVTISNSKYIETNWGIFDDKDYLSFTPAFNVILGTQNFVQKYSTSHPGRLGFPNEITPPISERYAKHNSEIDMLNYSFKIPIAYNRPHYTFEFSYKYSIPVNVEGILRNRKESFYNLTFYYVFY